LPVDSVHGRRVRDAGVQSGHTGDTCTTARRKNVADCDILDELRVDARPGVGRAQNGREELLRTCVLEAALLPLWYTVSVCTPD
jgi:hypothetical protein